MILLNSKVYETSFSVAPFHILAYILAYYTS